MLMDVVNVRAGSAIMDTQTAKTTAPGNAHGGFELLQTRSCRIAFRSTRLEPRRLSPAPWGSQWTCKEISNLWYGICSGIRVYQCVQAQHVREIVSGEDSRSLGVVKHLWTRQCGSSHSFSGNATVAETVAESVVDAADVGLRASPASSTPLSCEASSSRRLWACSMVQIRLLKLRRG